MKYETEEEQVQAIKEWWQKNGTQLLLGILVIVAAYSGWNYWKNKTYVESVYASSVFEAMQVQAERGQLGEIAREGLKLMEEQPDSPYSTGVALILAKFYQNKNEKDRVIENYQWVIQHAPDTAIKTVAQLRLARYYADQKQWAEAEKTLKTTQADHLIPEAKANYDYVAGTIALFQNKTEAAKTAFKAVVANPKVDAGLKAVAQLQLDDLS